MNAHVYVTLKRTVLDAQGQTITQALQRMQHTSVKDVRQGKYFLLTMDDAMDRAAATAEVERIAREILSNPTIEEFTFRLD
jgi:phosphoribosylformylglycinamidine synthase PurS subunit